MKDWTGFLIPKQGKKPKRSRTPIAAKSVFKAHGDNPLKTYRRRSTDAQVMAFALQRRAERLADMPAAQRAFNELLDGMRILYEAESIFLNGDRFVLIDAYVKSAKVAFEVDGDQHKAQASYDAGRDSWLLRAYGVRTIRFPNAMVFKRPFDVSKAIFQVLFC